MLEKYRDELQESEPYFLAASNAIRNQTIRVFEEGGVGPGREKYKGGPLYINPKNAVRKFPIKGKNGGGAKFKNGKPRKTRFFINYEEYKKTIGEPAFVNLKAFGNLFRAFGTGLDTKLENGRIRVFHSIRINAANSVGKVQGLMSKYPAAFKLTQEEIDEYMQDLRNYNDDLIQSAGL